MSPFENADYTEEVSITSLGGLDFTNMANNEIIRKTSDTTAEGSGTTIQDEVAGEFYIKKIFNFINVPPFNILLGGILNSYNILTSSYKTQIAPKSSSIGSSQGLFLTSTVLDGNIKVGINISEPEEELEIDGNIQIDSGNVARLKFQKSGGSPHALGEIDGEEDGTNGGDLQFFTKVDGGSVTEKLRINNKGAIGVGGANFGNDGDVLTSNGTTGAVSWTTPTSPLTMGSDAPASGSGGVTITNNQIIYTPPVVISSSSPTFTGTVTAGSLCTTGAYKINNNRFTVNTAGYLNINRANGAGAGEWDSANGNIVVATLYYTGQVFYSDDRIKSNTRDISNATTTLMKLKPVQYEKHPDLIVPEGVENTDLTGVEHYTETGFVAQEVEKIPELAYTVEEIKYNKDKLKGIKISDFIPFLVKALQEQETRIQALENK